MEGGAIVVFLFRNGMALKFHEYVSIMIKQYQNSDAVLPVKLRDDVYVNNYRSHVPSTNRVNFARYPSQLALTNNLQLQKNTLLNRPSSRSPAKSFNKFSTKNLRFSQQEPRRNSLRPESHRIQVKKLEINENLVRAWKEVDKSLMRQRTGKTSPFNVVKSLSLHTLKRKAQVEEKRKQRLRRYEYNPFGSAIDSEYLN